MKLWRRTETEGILDCLRVRSPLRCLTLSTPLLGGFDLARQSLLRILNLWSADKFLALRPGHLSRFPNLQSFLLALVFLLNDLNVLNGLNDLNQFYSTAP